MNDESLARYGDLSTSWERLIKNGAMFTHHSAVWLAILAVTAGTKQSYRLIQPI
jgi:hypothetical protein